MPVRPRPSLSIGRAAMRQAVARRWLTDGVMRRSTPSAPATPHSARSAPAAAGSLPPRNGSGRRARSRTCAPTARGSRGSGTPRKRTPCSLSAMPVGRSIERKHERARPHPLAQQTRRARIAPSGTPRRRSCATRSPVPPSGSNVTRSAWSRPAGGRPNSVATMRLGSDRPRSTSARPVQTLVPVTSCSSRTRAGSCSKRSPSSRR